jgi:hypothetical protein
MYVSKYRGKSVLYVCAKKGRREKEEGRGKEIQIKKEKESEL